MRALACAVVLACVPLGAAWAGGETGVLPVEVFGDVPPSVIQRVNESIADRNEGASVVTQEERDQSKRTGCKDPDCWASLGHDLAFQRVLATSIAPAPEGHDRFTLSSILVEVATSRVLGRGTRVMPKGAAGLMPGKLVHEILWNAPRYGEPEEKRPSRPGWDRPPPGSDWELPQAPVQLVQALTKEPPTAPAGLIGARVGVTLPQAFNSLGSSYQVEIEGGYQLPFWRRRLGVFADIAYTRPSTTHTAAADPRISPNNGTVVYDLQLDQLSFAVGPQLRWALGRWLVPYAGAGVLIALTKTTLAQKAGRVDLGTITEQSTRLGFLGRLGAGVHFGPGDVVLELQVAYAPITHFVTGDSNTSQLVLALGYLLRL